MYWFAGLNDNDSYYKELYLAALESSKKTKLLPILLYNGIDETFINIIKSKFSWKNCSIDTFALLEKIVYEKKNIINYS